MSSTYWVVSGGCSALCVCPWGFLFFFFFVRLVLSFINKDAQISCAFEKNTAGISVVIFLFSLSYTVNVPG
jgi:hypothetical protein